MFGWPKKGEHGSPQNMGNRVPRSCQTGLGHIGFWRVDCGEPKYVLIFAITDNTVHRAVQLFIVLLKSKM